MTDIDFLPSEYKDRCALRRAQPVEIMLACIMTASLIAASFVFIRHREKATEALVRIKPSYEMAIAQRSRLTAMENDLNRADAKAELLAYLRHPLAKSQLLTAIASKLPDDVSLCQIRIAPEKINNSPAALRASADDGRATAIAEKDRLDADKDLRLLWEKEQQEQTLVEIAGSASDIASIHRFLNNMATSPLFVRTELTFLLRQNDGENDLTRFTIKTFVRPETGRSNDFLAVSAPERAKSKNNPH